MVELETLGANLFIVEGPPARDMGIPFSTRMAVARLADGSVLISSPVAVPFTVIAGIAALGTVRYLVSATPRHFWRLEAWHRLFPEAELWSSPITPITLKRGNLALTGVLSERAPEQWARDFDQVMIRGSNLLKEVAFFHRDSRTLLLEDIIQIHGPQPGHPLRKALIALGGVKGPGGGVPRDIRLTFRDRAALRDSVDRILAWDFDTVVMAHGPLIRHGGRQFVERAFAWL